MYNVRMTREDPSTRRSSSSYLSPERKFFGRKVYLPPYCYSSPLFVHFVTVSLPRLSFLCRSTLLSPLSLSVLCLSFHLSVSLPSSLSLLPVPFLSYRSLRREILLDRTRVDPGTTCLPQHSTDPSDASKTESSRPHSGVAQRNSCPRVLHNDDDQTLGI